MGALAILLSFCKAADALGICSRVCKSFQAAALHSSAWPSLKLCSSTAERVVDSLSYILMSTCANLQDLSLDITFQQQGPQCSTTCRAGSETAKEVGIEVG